MIAIIGERIKVFEGIGWIGKRVSILILAEIAIMTKPIFCLEVGLAFLYRTHPDSLLVVAIFLLL
ncbi:MAG: hypothetical protein BRC44_13815 [Cyanobacteria bacterium QS_4_48_99]|nr:MAG: hypothetical protein BRC44_13815 [Cyanobacteria bacterium QS_4_48_99]